MADAPDRSRAPLRILLVEDDETFRWITRRILTQRTDYEVIGEAADGREGVEAAGELQPDVVLLDLRMPGMGGFEALPLIREASPESRVILYTGLASDQVREQAQALGAFGVVEKDPSSDVLLETLKRAEAHAQTAGRSQEAS